MKMRIFIFGLLIMLTATAALFAGSIDIGALKIPIFEGAAFDKKEYKQDGRIAVSVYSVKKSLNEVISFYEKYLKENNFIVIGGRSGAGFDAAAKKDNTMFTLKIYYANQKTIIQFIW